jgi:hypothetical protein
MDIIYSIGDGAYLATVLNAVAAITAHSDFGNLVRIGFILGVILVSFQAILTAGREWRWDQFIVAVLVYMVMFGPKMTVHVHDVYNGSTRTVDNVPIGVGMVGSLISTVGKNITEFFEVGFSMPQMLQGGFGSVIHHYLDTRNIDGFGTANSKSSVAGGPEVNDLSYSIYNYVRDCTMTGVVRGEKSIEQIENSADVLEAIRWDSNVWGTSVKLGLTGTTATTQPDKSVAVTCNEAYQKIFDRINNDGAFQDAYRDYVNAIWGGDAELKLQTSLDFISEATSETYSAMKHMINSSMRWQVQQAALGHFQQNGNEAMATMMGQAIEQRAIQWTAEASLFSRLVRPLQTFFEAFLFSITPFMALLIGLGTMGIKMIGKYLLFGLWIQLWLPVMAIINLFLNVVVQSKLGAIDPTGLDVTSLRGFLEVSALYQDYLTTAGMLAASVPAITLLLIYGSSITATSLAGRLQSGDFVNEKQLSPDIVQPAAASQMGAMYQSDFVKGTQMTGAQNFTPGLEIGSSLAGATQSALQFANQKQDTFANNLANSITKGASVDQSFEALSALGSMVQGSQGKEAQAISQKVRSNQDSLGLSEGGVQAVTGIMALMGSGKISASVGTRLLSEIANQNQDFFSDTAAVGASQSASNRWDATGGGSGKPGDPSNTRATEQRLGAERKRQGGRRQTGTQTDSESDSSGVNAEVSGGITATAQNQNTLSKEEKMSRVQSFLDSASFSNIDRGALLQQVASQFDERASDAYKLTTNEQQRRELQQSAQDVESSAETYQQLQSFQQSHGRRLQAEPGTVLAMMAPNMGNLWNYARSAGFADEMSQIINDPRQNEKDGMPIYANSAQRDAAAFLKAIDALPEQQQVAAMATLIGQGFDGTPLEQIRPSGVNPYEYATLANENRTTDLPRQPLASPGAPTGATFSQVEGRIAAGEIRIQSPSEFRQAQDNADAGPNGMFQQGTGNAEIRALTADGRMSRENLDTAFAQLREGDSLESGTVASRLFGIAGAAKETLESRAQQLASYVGRGTDAMGAFFSNGFSAEAAQLAWSNDEFRSNWVTVAQQAREEGAAYATASGFTGRAADLIAETYAQDVFAHAMQKIADSGVPGYSLAADFISNKLGYGEAGQASIDAARNEFVEEQKALGTPDDVIERMTDAIDMAYISGNFGAASLLNTRAILNEQHRSLLDHRG